MAQFAWQTTDLPDVVVATRKPIGDNRGFFERLYDRDVFAEAFGEGGIVQMNRSHTRSKGSLRGMHRQLGAHAERKVITCLRGRVFDVAVDMRPDRGSFGRWVGVELSEDNNKAVVIPEGFAHGFQTLTDDCQLLYLHSTAYAPRAEGGVNALDPELGITWPLEVAEMSDRDRALPPLKEVEKAST